MDIGKVRPNPHNPTIQSSPAETWVLTTNQGPKPLFHLAAVQIAAEKLMKVARKWDHYSLLFVILLLKDVAGDAADSAVTGRAGIL